MKKLKNEKAITVIALIITIIILLILATVSISSIQGDNNLIDYANNTTKKYKKESERQESIVQNYWTKVSGNNEEETEEEYVFWIKNNSTEVIEFYTNANSDSAVEKILEYRNESNSENYLLKSVSLTTDIITSIQANTENGFYYFKDEYWYSYNNGMKAKYVGKNVIPDELRNNIFGLPLVSLENCFENVTLASVPTIPSTVTNISNMFHQSQFKSNITIEIPESVILYSYCFSGATGANITLTGNNSNIASIAATSINNIVNY